MFRPNQPHRDEVTYHGEESNFEDVRVRVLKPVTINDPEYGESDGYQIRLPITGKVIAVFEDELTPTPNAPETLVEKLDYLLTWGHPACAGFVIDSLVQRAENVINNAEEVRERMKNHFISPEAWIEAAKATKTVFDDRP